MLELAAGSMMPRLSARARYALLAFGLAFLTFEAAAAGRVLYVKGDARYEREGRQNPLTKGTMLIAGDILTTGEDGRVQLIMDDGDRMALRPRTVLRIDEFAVPTSTAQPSTGRAFYTLVRGGFRALTRSLGRRDDASYRVMTPVATIGIRGTHYSLRMCVGDCEGADGLYAGVDEGGIRVANQAGELELSRGAYAFVGGQGLSPQRLMSLPEPLKDDTQGGSGDGSGGDSLSNRTSPAEGEMDPPSGIPGAPSQTIQGADPSGAPFDFTSGQPPSAPTGPLPQQD